MTPAEPKTIALLDACVLYPPSLRDLLMWLATVEGYAPRMTEDIHAEWIRNVLADRQDVTPEQLDRTRRLMNQVAPDCLVSGYETLIPTLSLPDANDRHVLAAAITARAAVIVTFNRSDFPAPTLRAYGVEPLHPDVFLSALFDDEPDRSLRAIQAHRISLRNPPKTAMDYIQTLRATGLTKSAEVSPIYGVEMDSASAFRGRQIPLHRWVSRCSKLNSFEYTMPVNTNCLKLRLYPTKAQARQLDGMLETCRLVYNSLLNDRKFQYETAGVSVGRYTQQAYLPAWKKDHGELTAVYSQVLQDVVHRVSLAFDAFFDRVKKGEKPGFPRLKGEGRYDSITYTQARNFRVGDSTLEFPKLGKVKAKIHRRPWGEVKNCTLRRINGKWFASLCQEIEPESLGSSSEAVGIDVGLKTFAALSNGELIDNPRFFRKDEMALAKAQRKLAKQVRGAGARRKARKVVTRIHERIRNRRHDFCHQNARRIVNRFGVIAVEKLNVKNMLGNHCLAKSIADAAWSQFRSILTSKAESAGREILAVNPAYTSQDCSGCGYRPDGLEGRTRKKLSDRWHLCPMCGLSVDRDTNAAVNILALGQQCLAAVSAEKPAHL